MHPSVHALRILQVSFGRLKGFDQAYIVYKRVFIQFNCSHHTSKVSEHNFIWANSLCTCRHHTKCLYKTKDSPWSQWNIIEIAIFWQIYASSYLNICYLRRIIRLILNCFFLSAFNVFANVSFSRVVINWIIWAFFKVNVCI